LLWKQQQIDKLLLLISLFFSFCDFLSELLLDYLAADEIHNLLQQLPKDLRHPNRSPFLLPRVNSFRHQR
jgi:hypothetical protein